MKIHKDSVHGKLKFWKCDLCPRSFGLKRSLQIHKDSIHDNIKFECTLCDKLFTQETHLRTHKQKHPHCEPCGKSFTQKLHLDKHMQEDHAEITT